MKQGKQTKQGKEKPKGRTVNVKVPVITKQPPRPQKTFAAKKCEESVERAVENRHAPSPG